MSDHHELWVPTYYWTDHVECDCSPEAVELKTRGHLTLVRLNQTDYDDLRSRVDYYRDPTGFDVGIQRGLCKSARAAWKRIQQHEQEIAA